MDRYPKVHVKVSAFFRVATVRPCTGYICCQSSFVFGWTGGLFLFFCHAWRPTRSIYHQSPALTFFVPTHHCGTHVYNNAWYLVATKNLIESGCIKRLGRAGRSSSITMLGACRVAPYMACRTRLMSLIANHTPAAC